MAGFRNEAVVLRSKRNYASLSSEYGTGIKSFSSSRTNGTISGSRDMQRMGKQQESKVFTKTTL